MSELGVTMPNDPSESSTEPSSKSNRRNILRTLGVGAVAAPLGIQFAAASGSNDGKSTFDTSFDPDDKKKVAKFVSDTFEWSNRVHQQATAADAGSVIKDQRQKVIEDLSDEQLHSVQEVLRDVDLTVAPQSTSDPNGDPRTDADISPSSCNNYGDTVAAYIHVPYVGNTLHAFTFEIDIGWCVDGDKVINVSPSTIGNAQGYVLVNWDYKGVSDESLTFHPDKYYAISYQKGKYKRCIVASSGVSCVATDYGWIEAVVYNDRSGRTTDKGTAG
ncbi:hypothetical protein V5735_04085 (plasmid) [Haladaptatus sp. SPP-AMP-3]|uniref:hypothetical protein n=1 Tax=Haladaptatus sp. SPP-AMP-3 TaxID=3121295 RepID=UPI003C2D161E